jgi:ABC-type multidrug transport system fused ATPase/permease subunit
MSDEDSSTYRSGPSSGRIDSSRKERRVSFANDEENPEELEPLLAESHDKKVTDYGGEDIVQFSASMYYIDEGAGKLDIDLIRLGSMEGAVAVSFFTEDLTATAHNYTAVSGRVVFEDGEHTKTLEIPIHDDGVWSATKEFRLLVVKPQNCCLDEYLFCARVKILNDNAFPSNVFKDMKNEPSMEKTSRLPSWALWREYWKLNFHSSGQRLAILAVITFDQLHAVLLFGTLWVGVYIIDTLFARGDPGAEKRLLLPDRYHTAMIVAAWYLVPCIVLYVWDHLKVNLDIKGRSRTFLQTSMMDTSLCYSPESRRQFNQAEMNVAVITSAEQLANSYVASLSIAGIFGRIVAILAFQILFQPDRFGIGCVLAMVAILVVFAIGRVTQAQGVQSECEEKQMLIETLTDESLRKYRLFADYWRRPLMADMFHKACAEYCKVTIPFDLTKLQTLYTTRFISSIFIGIYIVVKTPAVLNRELSLGVFIATITIFSTYLADAITELNSQLMAIVEGFVPLKEFTRYLNLPLELELLKKVSHEREAETRRRRVAVLSPSPKDPAAVATSNDSEDVRYKSDLIRIEVSNVTFEHQHGQAIFKDISLSLPQGHMVAITGPHNSGKATFVQLLCTIQLPRSGSIFVPSYLRVLHVSRSPLFMHSSLLHNLTLGLVKVTMEEKHRICEILELLEMKSTAQVVKAEWDMAFSPEAASSERCEQSEDELTSILLCDELRFMHSSEMAWEHSLTQSMKSRLHIARALIANPEVMVLDRTLEAFNEEAAIDILNILKQHVEERGLCKPHQTRSARRPRDVFFTTENRSLARYSNFMLELDPGIKSMAMLATKSMQKKYARQDSESEDEVKSRWSFSENTDTSSQTTPRLVTGETTPRRSPRSAPAG